MTVADRPERYPVERTETALRGKVIEVRSDWVRLPSGNVVRRDYAHHPGAVGIVALDPADRVLLLRQYRHAPGRLLWEPPAGLLDVAGEPPLQTARRELFEEAHCRAGSWAVLVDVLSSPGMSDEAVRVYLARELTAVDPADRHVGVDEEADLPVEWLPLDEAVGKVLAGELHNPTAVYGILAAYAARARGWADLRPADAPWPDRP